MKLELEGSIWHYMDAETVKAYGPWVRHSDYARRTGELRRHHRRLQEQVETLQYKAEKYDAVVKALSVCDGGRYRNDTIESCILALKVREAAEAERDRLREENERLREACRIARLHAPIIRLAPERRHTISVLDAALQKEPQP